MGIFLRLRPLCWHGGRVSWQVLVRSSEEHTTRLCGASWLWQRGPSVQWPTTECLWNKSKLGPAAFEQEPHMPNIAIRVTSGLCEMSFVMFGHVGNLLLASLLGNAHSHMMPVKRCVDVDMEGYILQPFYSIQKARHLQNNNIIILLFILNFFKLIINS